MRLLGARTVSSVQRSRAEFMPYSTGFDFSERNCHSIYNTTEAGRRLSIPTFLLPSAFGDTPPAFSSTSWADLAVFFGYVSAELVPGPLLYTFYRGKLPSFTARPSLLQFNLDLKMPVVGSGLLCVGL